MVANSGPGDARRHHAHEAAERAQDGGEQKHERHTVPSAQDWSHSTLSEPLVGTLQTRG